MKRIQFSSIEVEKKKNPVAEIVNYFYILKGWDNLPKEQYKKDPRKSYPRLAKEAKQLLVACENKLEDAMFIISKMDAQAKSCKIDWTIKTALKFKFK